MQIRLKHFLNFLIVICYQYLFGYAPNSIHKTRHSCFCQAILFKNNTDLSRSLFSTSIGYEIKHSY